MTQPSTEVAKTEGESKVPQLKKDVTEQVLARVLALEQVGELHLPADYSAPNALKSAFLLLNDMTVGGDAGPKVLVHCEKGSIANALLKMVVEGLSPMKHQCAFIVYGNRLTCQRQYQGNIALAKRFGDVKDVRATVIYQDDDFQYDIDIETGRKKIVKHVQSLKNIDPAKIIGAYATVILNDGSKDVEIMTMDQITKAWQQGATKGNSPAHRNFKDQMCIKTVINRGCKLRIQSSDDAALKIMPDPSDIVEDVDHVEIESAAKIDAGANKEPVTFDNATEVKDTVESPTTEKKDGEEKNPGAEADF